MALVKCKECGSEVSNKATACPKCGAKQPKRTSALVKVLAVVLIPGCIAGVYSSNKASEEKAQSIAAAEAAKNPEQKASEAAAKAREESEFQRAVIAAKTIKARMKNPDSFQLSAAIQTSDGTLCLQYRGTNSFNAVVPGLAVIPSKGNPSAGAESAVADAWNKHCSEKVGRNMMHIRHAL